MRKYHKEEAMIRTGTISYNIYCNFTNYGSALQTWALHQAVKKLGHSPVLVDYCPDILADKDPLNPFGSMWDKDEDSRRMAALTMPAIRENFAKFDRFYHERFDRTEHKYTSRNFSGVMDEGIDGFICGSDTIFCPDEFGFDDGYYAEYECMRGRSVSYAASFGDTDFTPEMYRTLNDRTRNFLALGIREQGMIPYLKENAGIPVQRTIDPTLLLEADEYNEITASNKEPGKYLLLYSRRYSRDMEEHAEKLAAENGWQIVEISLRADNAKKGHKMAYSAGVEEFLSLARNAEYIVTNSYHGLIFSIQFRRPFTVFIREQASSKITELLNLCGIDGNSISISTLAGGGYNLIHKRIMEARKTSLDFLRMELSLLEGAGNVS